MKAPFVDHKPATGGLRASCKKYKKDDDGTVERC